MKNILILLLSALGLCSCIKEVDLEMPSSQGILIMNALVKNGADGISVHLSESNAFENTTWPQSITDAEIKIKLNQQEWTALALCDTALGEPINQFCLNGDVTTGDNLSFRARYNNKAELWAKTEVPEFPEISELQFIENQINFLLHQPGSVNHYYIIDVIDTLIRFNENLSIDTLIEQSQLSTADATLELLGGASELIDLPIDRSYGDMAFVNSSTLPLAKRPVSLEFHSFNPNEHKYLRIRKCSFDYYEFYRSRVLSRKGNDNPFSQPVNYHSNVHNGLGVVGAYSEIIYKIEL